MNRIRFLLVLMLFARTAFCQNAVPLNSKTKAGIVNNISELLLASYVFPDTAVKMSNRIRGRLKERAYHKITDPVAFADALTIDLLSVYHDNHLLVQYAPQAVAPPTPANGAGTPANNEDPLEAIRQVNFGIRKVEVLNGNIGYLKIERFLADSVYGKATLNAVMQFLSHSKTIIIDLRDCGGGSQDAVNMTCSYFFENSVHLNDMFNRPANTTTAYWTKPDPSFSKLAKTPLYLLTNDKTFSAGEEFCYDLQNLKRATLVGETTGGGAHGTFSRDAGNGFVLFIPYSTAINPVTKTSWEKTGVKPEIEVPSDKALETAEINIMNHFIANAKSSLEVFNLNWDLDLLKTINNPISLDTATLKSYAGVYGERVVTFENGKLFYQRTGRPKFELEAMSETTLKGKGNNYFRIEFVKNDSGIVDQLNAYYQDNRMETSMRNK